MPGARPVGHRPRRPGDEPRGPATGERALARDPDERVRLLLARKLAALAPSLSATDQAQLHRETWDILSGLVADEAVRVRATIAEAVKDMPDAPRELILRLARDTAMTVSEPVIRFSPLLTTEDLLALLADAPAAWRHPRGCPPRADRGCGVRCDRRDGGRPAIRALLANPSAQIREATLDALVARAAQTRTGTTPLVRRPALPPRAARMLSEIVATHLLEVLATRADLAPSLAEDLRRRIAIRLTLQDTSAPRAADDTTAEQAWRRRTPWQRWQACRGSRPGSRPPRRGALCHGAAGGGSRHVGLGGGSRLVAAQRQGAGQPSLEGRLHHARRDCPAEPAGAAGVPTRC